MHDRQGGEHRDDGELPARGRSLRTGLAAHSASGSACCHPFRPDIQIGVLLSIMQKRLADHHLDRLGRACFGLLQPPKNGRVTKQRNQSQSGRSFVAFTAHIVGKAFKGLVEMARSFGGAQQTVHSNSRCRLVEYRGHPSH